MTMEDFIFSHPDFDREIVEEAIVNLIKDEYGFKNRDKVVEFLDDNSYWNDMVERYRFDLYDECYRVLCK